MPGIAGTPAQPGPSRRGAGSIPALLRICHTVDGATVMPSPASSPWIRRYPHDSFSRASRSTTDRTLRRTGGRPDRPRRDRRAQRRRTMSRCQRKIGAGSDDQPHRGEALDRQRPGEQRQPRPVRPRQPRMSPRPLAQGDRELMAQHQDLGVLPPRLPARQAQQRHGTGDDQEDQLQAHKPKIIARSGDGPDLPARHRTRDRADGDLQKHLPRWHRFSAPTGPPTLKVLRRPGHPPQPEPLPIRLLQNARLVVYNLEHSSVGRADIYPVRPRKNPCLVRGTTPGLPSWFTASWGAVFRRRHLPLLLGGQPDVPPIARVVLASYTHLMAAPGQLPVMGTGVNADDD